MPRPAIPADLPALLAIREAAGADALSDPALVIEVDLRRLIATGSVTVWEEGDQVAGFAAVDAGTIHLLVDTARRGKGAGRELLAAACAALKAAGHVAATLTLAPGGAAERHYRAAGWLAVGETAKGGTVLKKPL